MSSRKKDLVSNKGSKMKMGKGERRASEISDARSSRSHYSPTSILKMTNKSFRMGKIQANPNESTYGALPEAKGFSTSVYKKGHQQRIPQFESSHRESEVKQQDSLQSHATYYLTTKGFRVLDKVGSGNYAKVYRVINPENREIAVKIIDLNKTSANYRVKFLPRELDILSRLSHRNIARVFEIVQLPKLIYIFMEYTPNGTVADFLRVYRAIPENFCQCMFIRIVDAICYLHRANICHRDLKLVSS